MFVDAELAQKLAELSDDSLLDVINTALARLAILKRSSSLPEITGRWIRTMDEIRAARSVLNSRL